MGLFKKNCCAEPEIDYTNLPVHIALIMDGNRRWARKNCLPYIAGHRAGASVLQNMVDFCSELGIRVLTVYAFSTENWKRSKDEVSELMDLIREYLNNVEEKVRGKNIRVRFLGNTSTLDESITTGVKKVEDLTKGNTGLLFNIALNYGGRTEIADAVRKICKGISNGELNIDSITEETVAENLYTPPDVPEPDLLIRTGGELRISNFLLWQLAYTELWFTPVYWPDFTKRHLLEALGDYQRRNRRYGGE